MRLQQDSLTRTKNFIHAAQACLILLAWILTIAVYVASGSTDGRTNWFFALVSPPPSAPLNPLPELITLLVLALHPNPDLPCHDAHVVPYCALRQRLRLCHPRCSLHHPLAQCVGSRRILRERWEK